MKSSLLIPLVLIIIIVIGAGVYLFTRGSYIVPSGTEATSTIPTALTFYCDNGATMQATFATSSVAISLSDGRSFTLPQAMSGSGIRYEATSTSYGTDVAFVGEGNDAILTENGQTTYDNCTAAKITSPDASGNETYTDPQNTFSFSFPSSFTVAGSAIGMSPGWSAPATTTGMILAKLTVPASYEPGTNFGDASFTVGTSADPSAVATCLDDLAGTAGTTTASLGGQTFTKLAFTGAGAGQRYDTTSYRTVRDNQCYAVEYTIHYGVIENYPKGTVTRFDEQKIASALDQVAQSFKFLGQ